MRWLPAANELGGEQNSWLDNLLKTNSNQSIVGFPGSGKTVMIVYAVIRLRKENPNCSILIVEFTHSLIEMLKASIEEVAKEEDYVNLGLENIEITTYYHFFDRNRNSYDYIICDEVQDVPNKVLSRMKDRARRVIVAGDPNQSIYEFDPKWKESPSTVEEVSEIISPEETKLTIIYRLTKRIIKAVDSFLPGMQILSGKTSMVKQNVQIRLWKFANQHNETKQIMSEAKQKVDFNESVGILVRTHDQLVSFANFALEAERKPTWTLSKNKHNGNDYQSLNEHLSRNGIKMQLVLNGYGNFVNNEQLITLTTFHSSKGLDFDTVFIPFCNNGVLTSDVDKRLFMVAMTRSRKNLFISYTSDAMNQNVARFKNDCLYKDWTADGMENMFGTGIDSGNDDFDF